MNTYPPSDYRAETLLHNALTHQGGVETLTRLMSQDQGLKDRVNQLLDHSEKASEYIEQLEAASWWDLLAKAVGFIPGASLIVIVLENGYNMIVELYERWPELEAKVGKFLDAFMEGVDNAGQWLSDAAAELEGLILETYDSVSDGFDAATDAISESIEAGGESIREAIYESGIGEGLEAFGDWFSEAASTAEAWLMGTDEEEEINPSGSELDVGDPYSENAGKSEHEIQSERDQDSAHFEEKMAERASEDRGWADDDDEMYDGDFDDDFDWMGAELEEPPDADYDGSDFGESEGSEDWETDWIFE